MVLVASRADATAVALEHLRLTTATLIAALLSILLVITFAFTAALTSFAALISGTVRVQQSFNGSVQALELICAPGDCDHT